MSEKKIGKVTRVPLRDVWPDEARKFTPWLADNIDVLNDALGFDLSDPETEQAAGSFSADIKALDEDGNTVVIENQYGKSNHDHLGKLLTYRSAFDASKAIWIMEDPRPEHVAALAQLDEEASGCDFYLLRAEGIEIEGSPAALLLTKIIGPNIEKKMIKGEEFEFKSILLKFWEQFLEESERKEHDRFRNVHPKPGREIRAKTGKTGIFYQYRVNKSSAKVGLIIEGKSKDENFKHFEASKESMGPGMEFVWDSESNSNVNSIQKQLTRGGYRSDRDEWPEIINEMIEEMKKFEKIMQPIINQLTDEGDDTDD